MGFRAVLFDWRGTLATTLTEDQWIREALRRLGRHERTSEVTRVTAALRGADADLDAPGTDTDADLHRRTYRRVLTGMGLDGDLVDALYEVESDPLCNVFADDAAWTLRSLRTAGIRVAVVSDVHMDIRTAFVAAGLSECVDAFVLSAEQGVQKPDARIFVSALEALRVSPDEALMVGDRAGPDGGAVAAGIVTLLLPPLKSPRERRLHRVLTLCGVGTGAISHAR